LPPYTRLRLHAPHWFLPVQFTELAALHRAALRHVRYHGLRHLAFLLLSAFSWFARFAAYLCRWDIHVTGCTTTRFLRLHHLPDPCQLWDTTTAHRHISAVSCLPPCVSLLVGYYRHALHVRCLLLPAFTNTAPHATGTTLHCGHNATHVAVLCRQFLCSIRGHHTRYTGSTPRSRACLLHAPVYALPPFSRTATCASPSSCTGFWTPQDALELFAPCTLLAHAAHCLPLPLPSCRSPPRLPRCTAAFFLSRLACAVARTPDAVLRCLKFGSATPARTRFFSLHRRFTLPPHTPHRRFWTHARYHSPGVPAARPHLPFHADTTRFLVPFPILPRTHLARCCTRFLPPPHCVPFCRATGLRALMRFTFPTCRAGRRFTFRLCRAADTHIHTYTGSSFYSIPHAAPPRVSCTPPFAYAFSGLDVRSPAAGTPHHYQYTRRTTPFLQDLSFAAPHGLCGRCNTSPSSPFATSRYRLCRSGWFSLHLRISAWFHGRTHHILPLYATFSLWFVRAYHVCYAALAFGSARTAHAFHAPTFFTAFHTRLHSFGLRSVGLPRRAFHHCALFFACTLVPHFLTFYVRTTPYCTPRHHTTYTLLWFPHGCGFTCADAQVCSAAPHLGCLFTCVYTFAILHISSCRSSHRACTPPHTLFSFAAGLRTLHLRLHSCVLHSFSFCSTAGLRFYHHHTVHHCCTRHRFV